MRQRSGMDGATSAITIPRKFQLSSLSPQTLDTASDAMFFHNPIVGIINVCIPTRKKIEKGFQTLQKTNRCRAQRKNAHKRNTLCAISSSVGAE